MPEELCCIGNCPMSAGADSIVVDNVECELAEVERSSDSLLDWETLLEWVRFKRAVYSGSITWIECRTAFDSLGLFFTWSSPLNDSDLVSWSEGLGGLLSREVTFGIMVREEKFPLGTFDKKGRLWFGVNDGVYSLTSNTITPNNIWDIF